MKRILISIGFVLVLSITVTAQGLYKIQYRGANNVVYDALMGWYGPWQMSTLRIKYRDPNVGRELLVEQNLVFMPQPTGFTLRGLNARFLSPTQSGMLYSPDSFIFSVCQNGSFPCVTPVDDQGLFASLVEFRAVSHSEAGGFLQNFGFITPTTDPRSARASSATSGLVMHLIVVADTNAHDIGSGVQVDASAILNDFRGIANELGIGFSPRQVSGVSLNRESVLSVVNELQPGRGDIVVFVYTGHGYRLPTDTDPYPRFNLGYGRDVSASEVFNILKKKGARLNITLADTCNDRFKQTKFDFRFGYSLKRSAPGANRNALEKLFLKTEANIIAASSEQGQLSGTDDNKGSVFTRTFLDTLKAETSITNDVQPSWTSIITKTRDLAFSISLKRQRAVFYIE